MDLSVDEIRTLLGMCVRGLRHFREHNRHLGSAEREHIHQIEDRVEESYDDLYPFAPDIGEPPDDSKEEKEKG
jgi:hypothetical protein